MASTAGIRPYAGPIEVFYDRILDDDGKTADLDIKIKMPNVTLQRFRGTTLLISKEIELEPIRDQLSAIFDRHRKNFKANADRIGNEEKGLRAVFQDEENVANYASGKPWSHERVLRVLAFDTYRASAGAANQVISKEMLPCTPLDEATPWTGYAIYCNKNNELIGRGANGFSGKEGISESGLLIDKKYRGQGLRQEAKIALAVHAFVFSQLGFKLNNSKVEMFSWTQSPSEELDEGLEILEDSCFPYGEGQERRKVGVPTAELPRLLDKVILEKGIEQQITINGKRPRDFF